MKPNDRIGSYKLPVDTAAIISSIVYQKKDKLRASVFVAGEFAFGINVASVEQFRLRKGDELTASLLEELSSVDDRISAKRTASKFLNARRRSEKEVVQKLKGEGFAEEIITEVTTSLITAGLINDEELAQAFIHDKLLTKAASKRELENLLYKKGISKTTIATVLADQESDETELARKAAEKKWPTILRKESDPRKRSQKLYAFLASRGFDQRTIKETVGKMSESEFSEFENGTE
ncbi:MAG TPA: RecX family transcriptional regulator [Candidatus Kapabacteria bacterium]|nr:RecX family transcriptional regulator [Candidatus Kapabacteria bacterium]